MKRANNWPRGEERRAVLLAKKLSKMAESPHAFVRGSTARFYEWMSATSAAEALPEGPPLWICGDCHLGNLGPVENRHGNVAIHVRDFDQTLPSNPCLDLVRLALSLSIVARGARIPGIAITGIVEEMIAGYGVGLLGQAERRARQKPPRSLNFVLQQAEGRSWTKFLGENIENTTPKIPLGARFWPLSDEEREEIVGVLRDPQVKRLITSFHTRDDDAELEVADAAHWVKGCSSLGHLRLAVLVRVSGASIKKGRLSLMDLKEAVAPLAPQAEPASVPSDDAWRVVEGARRMCPYLGDRMQAIHVFGRPVFMRELLPQDLKIDIEGFSENEARRVSRHLAAVVGRAHGRQLAMPDRVHWSAEVRRSERKSLHAPSWLWKNVVALVARHEAAYLEHCRQYAFQKEARKGEVDELISSRTVCYSSPRHEAM
jgi:uncharacterized protein (DUF2252 family)